VKAVGIERGGGPPEKQGGEAIMFEWIIVGLVSGWLAGKIINGVGYGMFCDIILGLVGGVVGGIIFEILGVRAHNFFGAVLMSTAAAMATRSKLRGTISGFGEVAARAHLPGWRTRDDVGIAVVHDPVSARRHEAIRLIKSVRVYDDLGLMLDGESPDFVDIASPPAYHAESVRAALTAGANVIVEKPLCLGVNEFDELAALAAKESRVLICVHNWKYAPAYAV